MRMPTISHLVCLLFLLCFYECHCMGYGSSREQSYDEDPFAQDFLMPGVRPTKPDEYICTAMSIPVDEIYIVNFKPRASMDTAHHMLLFGCEAIDEHRNNVWNCGSMGVCSGESQILFAWARNAPAPSIPSDVGFKIGNRVNINFLVLQIHYGNVEAFQDGSVDNSGLTLSMTSQSQQYLAGIYLLYSGSIVIPPHAENVHSDIACKYQHQVTIHPFAFRTHSHDLGRVITGYRIRNGRWQVLGKGNPMWPQAFYPMKREYEIQYGDILAARCTYSSTRNSYTKVGPTGQDEMCNFYMMYYTDANKGFSFGECGKEDPDLFQSIPPGSDDPPPFPFRFNSGPDISILDYDHNHDLPENSQENADYLRSSEINDVGDLQETTPMSNEKNATESVNLTNVENMRNSQDLTKKEDVSTKLHHVNNWLGDSVKFGQVAGVDVDAQGDVHVFHRADRNWTLSSFDNDDNFLGNGAITSDTVVVLDKNTGNKKRSWGANQFYMPHGLTIDYKGYIWVTDVALHQVFKYPPEGGNKPLLTLGERLKPGKDWKHFCKPTDVVVDPDGSVFVADGYCNSRILKFSADGKSLLVVIGNSNLQGIAPDFFQIPHSLTMLPEKNKVCVADRENGRILCFDATTGELLKVFHPSERVFATEYNRHDGGILYAVSGPIPTSPPKGFTIAFEDASVSQNWSPDKGFSQPHDVAVSPDGSSVYVADLSANVFKFVLDLGIHENDKKSAAASLSQNNLDNRASLNDQVIMKKNKSPVMSKAANAATAIVVCILIVPIVCIFIVAIFVRLRDQWHGGIVKGFPRYKSTQDRFSVGNFFNKRKGFNPVTTEGSDLEDDGSWTDGSDVEEYSRLTGIRAQNL